MPRLAELLAVLETWYEPGWAETWDAVGLTCGDPRQRVDRLLLAVDAVPATVTEAERRGAQLLLTHHPLLLTAVHGVPADHPKGALVHRLIRAGVAHYVVHTNAEVGRPGVSDALADAVGLVDVHPLVPAEDPVLDKVTVFVPTADAQTMVDALSAAGAGRVGDYDRCSWWVEGTGTFRPGPRARPAVGRSGQVELVREARVEMVLAPADRVAVVAALRRAHPYEEPAFDLVSHAAVPGRRGVGRIGRLGAATPLREFGALVAARLPPTAGGVRVAGDLDTAIERVAVLAGSGSSLVDAARTAGADVLVTADLKHHNAVEAVTQRGPGAMALVDVSHWAGEVPWLHATAERLRRHFGDTVDCTVSDTVTDPWGARFA